MAGPSECDDPRVLIEHLRDYRTRGQARQRLAAMGERAVEPLLECLGSPDEGVAWSAVTTLGELRARRAAQPLVELLERNILPLEAARALELITGQSHGMDAAAWRRAIGSEAASPREDTPIADPKTLLERAVGGAGPHGPMRLTGDGEAWRVVVPVRDGRTQTVSVLFGQRDAEGDELVIVFSECGPAEPKHYESLLRYNVRVPYGGFGIHDIRGTASVVMVDTLLRAEATPRQVRKSIENIARRADSVEKRLTAGGDER